MNKDAVRAIHSHVLRWMADNTKLMNSGLIFSLDTQSWHYFYDEPLTGTPSDIELISATEISRCNDSQLITSLISEVRIIETKILKDTREALKSEYDHYKDLSHDQRYRLYLINIGYEKLCGSC